MHIQYNDTRIADPSVSIPDWFASVIAAGQLAKASGTPGCQILDRNGAALWWQIQQQFDPLITALGYDRMAFPTLIPRSLFEKEEAHVDGFAPEFAMITEMKGERLEDPLVLRPTSEVVIYDELAKTVHSLNDLPQKINQWCAVYRVEKRTRPLMRTMEFFWHEAHWAIAHRDEAISHTREALNTYTRFMEDILAIPVVPGEKTRNERFAGAEMTLTVEARMLDGKALQCGTSHMMGTGFAAAYGISFPSGKNQRLHPVTGSWGMSTRIMGAIVMTHSDERGLVLPPMIAPTQCVILAVHDGQEPSENFRSKLKGLTETLSRTGLRFAVDDKPVRLGRKHFAWEKLGVPLRLVFGPDEMAKDEVTIIRRDTGDVVRVPHEYLTAQLPVLVKEMQQDMYGRAKARLDFNVIHVGSLEEFETVIRSHKNAFVAAGWCDDADAENRLKEEYGYTIRCIPFAPYSSFARCFFTGQPARAQVLIAKSY